MKRIPFLIFTVIFILGVGIILNLNVSTQQCIDYKCKSINIPLYLKILDFLDRHYNYLQLVKNITKEAKNEEERVMNIFEWTHKNIRRVSESLPVVDDHQLNIIIRGYGTDDQCEDVFTLLCTYAGLEAYFSKFYNSHNGIFYISFVRIENKWYPFSAFSGTYAVKNGILISVEDILREPETVSLFSLNIQNFEITSFIDGIRKMRFESKSLRTKGQSPLKRLIYSFSNIFRKK